jgi:DNA-directed RNA polymerase specialized sigma24 family protein
MTEFERLIAEVAAGSEDAVWELAETYTPYIIRAVRLSLSPKVRAKLDSQDIAQTLWASLLLGDTDLTRLKSPEVLIAFLARAAKNKVIDKTRQLNTQKYNIAREEPMVIPGLEALGSPRQPAKTFHSRDCTPSTLVSVREQWTQILSKASNRDQRIVRMRTEGRTFEEISVEVQVSAMTARRAIERLVEQLTQ